MAVDGPGIVESDPAHDIYNLVLDLYDAGVDVHEILTKFNSHRYSLDGPLFEQIHLTAGALALWEIGLLDDTLVEEIKQSIESGKGLADWRDKIGDDSHRRKALTSFLRKVCKPRKRPRPRKRHSKVVNKLYSVGDCLLLHHGAHLFKSVVYRISEYRGACDYLMLVMQSATAPDLASFRDGLFYGRKIPTTLRPRGFELGAWTLVLGHRMLLREHVEFEDIGNLSVDESEIGCGRHGGILTREHVIEEYLREEKAILFGETLLPLRDILLDQ